MRRMLYITAFPPNDRTGGQAFSLRAIRDLSRTWQVDVWYFAYPGHTTSVEEGGGICSVRAWSVPRYAFLRRCWLHPAFARRMGSAFVRELRRVAAQYDTLYFDFSQVAWAACLVEHPCKVVRMHDVLCQKYDRRSGWLGRWVRAAERKVVQSATKVLVPSAKDAALLRSNYGVEADYTHEYLKEVVLPEEVTVTDQMVFYGYWKRAENTEGLLWFVRHVLPLLRTRRRLLTIGGGMSEEVKRELQMAGVECLGFVQDPMPELLRSSAVLVPLFQGAGVKVKVIDAYTVGTPVIGTDLAFEGLPATERLTWLCNTPQAFAEAIDSFQPISYAEKKELRALFLKAYDNRHLAERLDTI